jgi:hypothetical protein
MTPRLGVNAIALALAFAIGLALGPTARGGATQGVVGQKAGSSPSSAPDMKTNYVGHLETTPARGRIGSSVQVEGTGFDPNVELVVAWQAFHGSWKVDNSTPENFKGRQFSEELVPLAKARTDADGAFTASITVPDGFGFSHDIRVLQGDVVRNQTSFYVEMHVTITPASGPVGMPIVIDAEGIGVGPLHSSWLLTYDNKFTGWISAVTTEGHARAVIPATGNVGAHVLKILHGSFTFPYLNMQQSPDPTRPTFTDIFTITPGPAVVPGAANKQWDPVVPGVAPGADGGSVIWTDPLEGQPGTQAILHGSGLPAGSRLAVDWQTKLAGGSYDGGLMLSGKGDKRPDANWELGNVSVDATGAFTWKFKVPVDKGGWHQITVADGDAVAAAAGFRVRPVASQITPASGPVGTVITLNVSGVDDTDTGKIFMTVYDNALVGYSCSVTGQGQITIYMPAAGAPGWHYIDLYPGVYKGEDLPGVYNYRLPQLTYKDDHPGEVLPAFHFAFEVTAGS